MANTAPLQAWICQCTQAVSATRGAVVQSLWSGYGEIVRYHLQGGGASAKGGEQVILKHVAFPRRMDHPRGWSGRLSHTRKVRSYQVEMYWYQHYALQCEGHVRLAHCFGVTTLGDEHAMLFEDLDDAGYPLRPGALSREQMHACLRWLANFHAKFLHDRGEGLWNVGSYWHLATRPDEWSAMAEGPLKLSAKALDARLNGAKFQTLVHGDAKVENFCFSPAGDVAAVDFQYVGRGVGVKDLAYFLGSCLTMEMQIHHELQLLDDYFLYLRQACLRMQPELDFDALAQEWRELYPVAQVDFYRFLQGWMPSHWKLNRHTARIISSVLKGDYDGSPFNL
ncbi:MAG: DUF1679 domain-containing protein [Zetaproteobacteria bacterium]|nr:DUF1679 domain-containing protein [Zetaproteobacteria bacterium]